MPLSQGTIAGLASVLAFLVVAAAILSVGIIKRRRRSDKPSPEEQQQQQSENQESLTAIELEVLRNLPSVRVGENFLLTDISHNY